MDLNLNSQARPKKPKICAIIPAYNEGKHIGKFIQALYEELLKLSSKVELIIIDDGSKDDTVKCITEAQGSVPFKLICFSRNFGKERAVSAGLDYADADVTLIIDGDFQHPLETIPELYEKWQQGYDNIYAVRSERKGQPFVIRFLSKMFYKLNKFVMNIDLPENAGDFRMIDRKAIEALQKMGERNKFMKGMYAWVGFSSCGIIYDVKPRSSGSSKWGFIRLLDLAITGITSFSNWPLRIWSLVGFLVSLLSLIYGIFIFIETLVRGVKIPGFATVSCGMFFLGGIQLLSIGVVAEYIARIFEEVKARPPYIVREIVEAKK